MSVAGKSRLYCVEERKHRHGCVHEDFASWLVKKSCKAREYVSEVAHSHPSAVSWAEICTLERWLTRLPRRPGRSHATDGTQCSSMPQEQHYFHLDLVFLFA